jgi:hypothetical protein
MRRMRAIVRESLVERLEPLCIYKRFENALHFELIGASLQPPQESHLDNLI